ncbi:MAG: type I restriction enzyme HsdR N-terminal domain-containing protein [Bacteroidota bacterium]
MTEVVFGKYNFKVEEREGQKYIFDEVRKKFVHLTSEEWVRQNVLLYLIQDKGYAKSLIAVERGIELNGLQKRFDAVVFGRDSKPKMIIECKGSEEKLDMKVFEQIARYNLTLKVDYLWVTNGKFNFCCRLKNGIELLNQVPSLDDLNSR